MNAVIDELKANREETIHCLRRGEYGYAERLIRKLLPFMQPDFQAQVVGHFNACNYVRVADLLEHLWKVVELPAEYGDATPTQPPAP